MGSEMCIRDSPGAAQHFRRQRADRALRTRRFRENNGRQRPRSLHRQEPDRADGRKIPSLRGRRPLQGHPHPAERSAVINISASKPEITKAAVPRFPRYSVPERETVAFYFLHIRRPRSIGRIFFHYRQNLPVPARLPDSNRLSSRLVLPDLERPSCCLFFSGFGTAAFPAWFFRSRSSCPIPIRSCRIRNDCLLIRFFRIRNGCLPGLVLIFGFTFPAPRLRGPPLSCRAADRFS